MNKVTNLLKKYNDISPTVKAGIWFTVCNILQRGVQFLTTPIYTRILTTEEYGMYSVFMTWLNIFTIFATLNLSSGPYYNGMLKYEENGAKYTSSIQSLGSIVTLLFAILFSLSFPYIEHLIGMPYEIAILIFAVAFVHPAFLFWSIQQRLNYKFKALIGVTILNTVLVPIIGIFLILEYQMGYVGLIVGYVVANVIVSGFFYIRNLFLGRQLFSKEYWGYSLKLSVPLIPHYLSQMVLGQSDRIMIKYYCGSDQAGIYSLAYQVSLLMNLLISGINNSLTPWMYRTLKEQGYEKIKKSTIQLIILVFVLSGVAMLMAPEIILILGTEEYLDAIWIIPPIMLSTCVTFVYCIWGTVLFYFERMKIVAVATSSGAILNVLLNILLIPRFGYIAAAYTTLMGYVVICLCYYVSMKKVCTDNDIKVSELFDIKTTIVALSVLTIVSLLVLYLYNWNVAIRYINILIVCLLVIKEKDRLIKVIKNVRK